MARFSYQGRDSQGKNVRGHIEAAHTDSAMAQLISQGIMADRIEPAKAGLPDLSQLFHRQVPLELMVIFCRQLYSLTKAGVPILRAIHGLAQSTDDKLLGQTLNQVGIDLTNGHSLSSAVAHHPRIFSRLFIAMLHVGENTGRLDQSLLQLANYYEQELETRKRIKSAMRYPLFVLSAIALAMVVLNIFVIPKFASMFDRFGVELPWVTKLLLGTSNFFVDFWPLLLGVVLAAILGFTHWRRSEKGELIWDHWRLKFPIVGSIVNRAQLARFSRTFALMTRAGVPLNQGVGLAAEALGNRYLETRLAEMKTAIESGASIATTATQIGVFTPLVQQMLAVGEETGQIDDLLLEVADFYDREVDYDLRTLTARIEPILLMLVAGMVLILALGIFLPMWNIYDVARGV